MTIIIADSGSTKTDWLIIDADSTPSHLTPNPSPIHRKPSTLTPQPSPLNHKPSTITSSGLNPCLMDDETITRILSTEVAPFVSAADAIHFYGAGCRPDQQERMARLLTTTLGAAHADVASDLLGAAHALCGDTPGIVAILGTGSGSALYNGRKFVRQTPSLGYILGDEGSGAVLGRRLVSDLYKGVLPASLLAAFEAEQSVDLSTIIHHVYSLPAPNRYLAQFTRFLSAHLDAAAVRDLIVDEFRRFFLRNIAAYERPDLPVHFVGSIAAVFEPLLRKSAATAIPNAPFSVGRILPSPIAALGDYWNREK